MLDFDPSRPPVPPRPASTVLPLRDRDGRVEVFCVVRHPKSGFLGGVVAFPGGKVDAGDSEAAYDEVVTDVHPSLLRLAEPAAPPRALAIAACRESLEEAAIVPTVGDALDAAGAIELREALNAGKPLATALRERGLRLDLGRLHTFARWVTPTAESRRFDATFFLLVAPRGQEGAFDAHETTSGFWETPSSVLERWARGEIQLAPPTVRCLELLAGCARTSDAVALVDEQSLLPICPKFVADASGPMLALPGDPAHDIAEKRVNGPTRFVLRDGRFVGTDPPPT